MRMSWFQITLWTLVLTVLFEAVTLICRFGFKWRAADMTRSTVGRLPGGLRFHHAYWVVPFVVLGIWCQLSSQHVKWLTQVDFIESQQLVMRLEQFGLFWQAWFGRWLGGLLIAIGWSMLFSDLLHHFVFLKALTGDSEWDWRYASVPVSVESK